MSSINYTDRFLNLADCLAITKLGKTAWYRLISQGIAPPPIKIGRKSVWTQSAVSEFIERMKAEAQQPPTISTAPG